jgi:hypothetical protein
VERGGHSLFEHIPATMTLIPQQNAHMQQNTVFNYRPQDTLYVGLLSSLHLRPYLVHVQEL